MQLISTLVFTDDVGVKIGIQSQYKDIEKEYKVKLFLWSRFIKIYLKPIKMGRIQNNIQ